MARNLMNGATMTTKVADAVVVEKYKVSCDGGGVNGHPRVFLQIPNEHGWVECPYCDTKFIHSDYVEKS